MKEEILLGTLRKILASDEGRPEGLLHVDLLLVIRLLLQAGDERPVYTGQNTLARELGCSVSTVARASARLKDAGWLELETGKRRHQPNKYFVLLEKIPLQELQRRAVVSPEAEKLAKDYMTEQRKAKPSRVFRKGTAQRYAYRLQTLLDKCAGVDEQLRRRIRFAMKSPKYRTAALRGPHILRRSWKSLTADYEIFAQEAAAQKGQAQ